MAAFLMVYILAKWFQGFFMFTPNLGEDEPILTHIFQRGWNHQLAGIEIIPAYDPYKLAML